MSPSDLLRAIVESAWAYGRMTREDAEGLAGNLVAIARYQARDALGVLGGACGSLPRAIGRRLR